jgi:hypothetical protein
MQAHVKHLANNITPIVLEPGQTWKNKSTIYSYRCTKHNSVGLVAGRRALRTGTKAFCEDCVFEDRPKHTKWLNRLRAGLDTKGKKSGKYICTEHLIENVKPVKHIYQYGTLTFCRECEEENIENIVNRKLEAHTDRVLNKYPHIKVKRNQKFDGRNSIIYKCTTHGIVGYAKPNYALTHGSYSFCSACKEEYSNRPDKPTRKKRKKVSIPDLHNVILKREKLDETDLERIRLCANKNCLCIRYQFLNNLARLSKKTTKRFMLFEAKHNYGIKKTIALALGELDFKYCEVCKSDITNKKKSLLFCSRHCAHNSKQIKDKKKQTTFSRYGVLCPTKNPVIYKKMIENNIRKYGVENPAHLDSVRDKARKTNMERYGVPNQMQNANVFEKMQRTSYARKRITIKGIDFDVQGYEGFAIKGIVCAGVDPKDILCGVSDVPHIQYKRKGIYRVYFPDLFLPKTNHLVEVKSTHTFGLSESSYAKNWFVTTKQKAKAAISCGYKFSLVLLRADGTRIKLPKDWYKMKHARIISLGLS